MTIRGIAYLVMALFVFTIQDAIVKHLTEKNEVIQILTWRILVVVVIIGCVAALKHGMMFLKTSQWPLMCLRGCLAFAAFTSYYFALSYLPLGDAATVFMTAPLIVTALSGPLLGEHVGVRRWLAVLTGFSAVVFMLNPGSDIFRPIALLPLASAFFYSFIPILTRNFNSRECTLTIVFYTSSSYALMCLIMTLAVHVWPAQSQNSGIWALIAQPWLSLNILEWLLVVLSSVLFTTGILCITIAYRSAEVSILAPFEYSYLLWATLIGYLVFSDVPTARTWVAGFVIAGSGIYIALRERKISQI